MFGASSFSELPIAGQRPAFGTSTSRADNSLAVVTPLMSLVTDEESTLVFSTELYTQTIGTILEAEPTAWSATDKSDVITLSEDRLTATNTAGDNLGRVVRATASIAQTDGKRWFEYRTVAGSTGSFGVGFTTSALALNWAVGSTYPGQTGDAMLTFKSGYTVFDEAGDGPLGSLGAVDTSVVVLIDPTSDGHRAWFSVDGGPWNGDSGADPEAGTGAWTFNSLDFPVIPFAILYQNSSVEVNFGTRQPARAIPNGFTVLTAVPDEGSGGGVPGGGGGGGGGGTTTGATWSATDKSTLITLDTAKLVATNTATNNDGRVVRGSNAISDADGKRWFEFLPVSGATGDFAVGFTDDALSLDWSAGGGYPGQTGDAFATYDNGYTIFKETVDGPLFTFGQVDTSVVMLVEAAGGGTRVWVSVDGGNWNGDSGADPAAGTGYWTFNSMGFPIIPFAILYQNAAIEANFGQQTPARTIPTGFAALDTTGGGGGPPGGGDPPEGVVFSSTDKSSAITLSTDELIATNTAGGAFVRTVRATVPITASSGQRWFIFKRTPGSTGAFAVGLARSSYPLDKPTSEPDYPGYNADAMVVHSNGYFAGNEAVRGPLGNLGAAGDNEITVLVDTDAHVTWFRVGSGAWNSNSIAEPSSGSLGFPYNNHLGPYPLYPVVMLYEGASVTANFGQETPVTTPAGRFLSLDPSNDGDHLLPVPLWDDMRPIAQAYIANRGAISDTNPRGFLIAGGLSRSIKAINPDGTGNDGTNPAYMPFEYEGETYTLEELGEAWADAQIAAANVADAQGILIWDLDGEEFLHTITYQGAPEKLALQAPETDYFADAVMTRIKNAGLRVGITLRPHQMEVGAGLPALDQNASRIRVRIRTDMSAGPPSHRQWYTDKWAPGAPDLSPGVPQTGPYWAWYEWKDAEYGGHGQPGVFRVDAQGSNPLLAHLTQRIQYAVDRWDCTMFYIDSTIFTEPPSRGISDEPLWSYIIWRQLHELFPDVLLIPENPNYTYGRYVCDYGEARHGAWGPINPDPKAIKCITFQGPMDDTTWNGMRPLLAEQVALGRVIPIFATNDPLQRDRTLEVLALAEDL
jgi:hypothetical protein